VWSATKLRGGVPPDPLAGEEEREAVAVGGHR
jgi:hypothetical protein